MKFRECDTINSKENIQVGYRNGSRIVNWWCINKTSTLNYGADTNLSFIIAYDIPRLHLNEFNRKYPGRLQKQTLKNGSWLRKLYTTIIYANHVLISVLVSSNCQDPVYLHDHSSDASCKIWWLSITEIDSSLSSIRKNYRIATMFIITQATSTPRDVEIRESVSMFCETRHFLKFERIE